MQKKKQQGEKIMFKFYIAFYTAKFIMFGIKLLKRLKIVKMWYVKFILITDPLKQSDEKENN